MKLIAGAFAVALLLSSAVAATAAGAEAKVCLRGDGIARIKMTAAGQALAADKQGTRYLVTFVTPCEARFQNTFFVLKPENLPTCIVPGTAFRTNRLGVCVVKTVAPAQ
jgi:hypothetical protein